METSLHSLDFGALTTLCTVHRLGSFTRAAEALDQSQPNVSYTIARLRKLFGDPLFVREGGRARPTPRCDALVSAANTLLEGFEAAVQNEAFDPANTDETVTISCNYYERATVLPGLIRHLRVKAPGLRLVSIAARTIGGEQLKQGQCDLVIGPVEVSGETVYRRHLRTDRYVVVMDPAHPLARQQVTLERLAQTPQIAVSFAGRWQPLYARAFADCGLPFAPVVELAEHGDIGACVLGTDLVAIIPAQLARALPPILTRQALPIDVSFDINLFWTARTHHAPLFRWLRAELSGLEKAEPARHPHSTGD